MNQEKGRSRKKKDFPNWFKEIIRIALQVILTKLMEILIRYWFDR